MVQVGQQKGEPEREGAPRESEGTFLEETSQAQDLLASSAYKEGSSGVEGGEVAIAVAQGGGGREGGTREGVSGNGASGATEGDADGSSVDHAERNTGVSVVDALVGGLTNVGLKDEAMTSTLLPTSAP
eukprot:TRINITY_DN8724_c0_g1_i1.p1 TRINITY_DN8724_c0_g1~~TRINITY_DN8724_c0_g1_i1.p1  ORF type:complete len:129 (-),score=31.73 TRINITY_DN8724_c0_g1_i1:1614-2000(-)